jgi:hypothetical protein
MREPTNPVQIAAFPPPAEEDYCKKGAKVGPHNLHENRSGSFQSEQLIFATYQDAGVRVFDIADPFARARSRILCRRRPKRWSTRVRTAHT